MDFSWTPNFFNGYWIFPLLCVLFMAIMMMGCSGMRSRFGHRASSGNDRETAIEILERRYASGEISKEQYHAIRRDLGPSQ